MGTLPRFTIDWATGQLMTKAADLDADLDEETGASYTVVVRATDPDGVPTGNSVADSNQQRRR